MCCFAKGGHKPSTEEVRLALGSLYPLRERLTRLIGSHYSLAAHSDTPRRGDARRERQQVQAGSCCNHRLNLESVSAG